MEKHIIINENKISDVLYGLLEKKYTLTYVAYDDSIPAAVFSDLLKNGYEDQFDEIFDEQRHYYAKEALDRLLDAQDWLDKDQKALFRTSDQYRDLLFEIESRDDSEAERDLVLNSRIQCRVMLHSNYDCWLPLWETGGLYGKDDALEGLMRMLSLNPAKVKQEALRQGISCKRAFPNLKRREGKEIVSYKGFIECLRECPNYGLWTFFGRFDMSAIWSTDMKTDTLVIPTDTTCTMFNDWNGGGSLAFTKTIRPVSIATLSRRGGVYDGPKVYVDEKFKDARGYSSGEVYGGVISSEEILCIA